MTETGKATTTTGRMYIKVPRLSTIYIKSMPSLRSGGGSTGRTSPKPAVKPYYSSTCNRIVS